MRRLVGFLFVMGCLSAPGLSQEPQTVTLKGKRIQRDGFLLEWNETRSQPWPGNPDIAWDAIRTGDGMSGYFRYVRKGPCNEWTFRFFPDTSKPSVFFDAAYQSGPAEGAISSQAVERREGGETVIVEWVLPWSQMAVDRDGEVTVRIVAFSGCRDTLSPLVLQGKRLLSGSKRPEALRPALLMQLLIAVILLALLLHLRSRARRFRR